MDRQISFRIQTLIFYAAIIIAILSFFRSCKGTGLFGLFGSKKTDTISIKSDTVWMIAQGDTVYVPKVQTITNTFYKPVYRTDTLESFEVLPADTATIIARFWQKAYYSDTQTHQYGNIIIQDTVYKNRIASRRLITNFKIPEVTNTITVKQNKNVVYVGLNAVGSAEAPLYAVGGDISLKSRNDKIYSVGAFTTKEGKVFYQAGFKVPVRLVKRK